MTPAQNQSWLLNRKLLSIGVILVAAITFTILLVRHASAPTKVVTVSVYVEKLKAARHYNSSFPAQKQTMDLFQTIGLRSAALNAIGEEPRDVGGMDGGDPETVFAMLSHLGGFGEIIWVDRWTNFPVKLPATTVPGLVVVPRRDAVRAALKAIEASGGCLIKAGTNRCLVVKSSEKEQYEAAIRALGWLDGTPAPWDAEAKTNK